MVRVRISPRSNREGEIPEWQMMECMTAEWRLPYMLIAVSVKTRYDVWQ
jgi:hypothetical protein